MTTPDALVEVRRLSKWYSASKPIGIGAREYVRALDDVSLDIYRGEVLGLVGESGSGKTTIGRILMRLTEPTSGSIRYRGQDITRMSRSQLRPIRKHMQLVFQDPFSSLNPRMRVERILSTPLLVHEPELSGAQRRIRIDEALRLVGLYPSAANHYPHEFSGGQRQRIGIARALMVKPEFLVADEPVSALDVSVQAQVINLLLDLRQQLGLTILFVAHDLAVVGAISDRVAVLYLGRLIELSDTRTLFSKPQHPYTEALLAAVPRIGAAPPKPRIVPRGDKPPFPSFSSGCNFRTRCSYAQAACAKSVPMLRPAGDGHWKACHRDDLTLAAPIHQQ
jgi:oligopeptide/dipeptide ABC transporter ATP-binding protein